MLNDGVLESNAIWTNYVGIDNEVIFSVGITHCHGLVPDFVAVGGFNVKTGDDGGK